MKIWQPNFKVSFLPKTKSLSLFSILSQNFVSFIEKNSLASESSYQKIIWYTCRIENDFNWKMQKIKIFRMIFEIVPITNLTWYIFIFLAF